MWTLLVIHRYKNILTKKQIIKLYQAYTEKQFISHHNNMFLF